MFAVVFKALNPEELVVKLEEFEFVAMFLNATADFVLVAFVIVCFLEGALKQHCSNRADPMNIEITTTFFILSPPTMSHHSKRE